jgi:hypothetical protein
VLTVISLYVGVKSAGCSVAEEAPIVAIFLVPTVAAVFLCLKFARA